MVADVSLPSDKLSMDMNNRRVSPNCLEILIENRAPLVNLDYQFQMFKLRDSPRMTFIIRIKRNQIKV